MHDVHTRTVTLGQRREAFDRLDLGRREDGTHDHGGIFVATYAALATNTTCEVVITFPGNLTAEIRGTVRWRREVDTEANTTASPGLGVSGRVDGRHLVLGSRRFLESQGVDLAPAAAWLEGALAAGQTVSLLAEPGTESPLRGAFAFADAPRATSAATVAALAVAGAEKILRREVDAKVHADLLKSVQAEL